MEAPGLELMALGIAPYQEVFLHGALLLLPWLSREGAEPLGFAPCPRALCRLLGCGVLTPQVFLGPSLLLKACCPSSNSSRLPFVLSSPELWNHELQNQGSLPAVSPGVCGLVSVPCPPQGQAPPTCSSRCSSVLSGWQHSALRNE